MDPISAVGLLASISSLADGAFKIVSFINTIREGGKQRLRLFTELNSLWMVLKLLEGHFDAEDEDLSEPWLPKVMCEVSYVSLIHALIWAGKGFRLEKVSGS